MIFEMAADNQSLSTIGNELIKREVPTANGNLWRKQTIAKILKNPFYKGMISYSGEINKGNHEAVVDGRIVE